MTTLEKIRAEIIDTFTWTNKESDLHYGMQKVIQIIDKYAEQEPCDDVVSRQAVLDCFYIKVTLPYDMDTGLLRAPLQAIVDAITKLPPVRPQEPKTGHWIGDKAYPICPKCNCNIIEEYISCSDYAEMYKPMKFCPNCGAKMVEPKESEEISDRNMKMWEEIFKAESEDKGVSE